MSEEQDAVKEPRAHYQAKKTESAQGERLNRARTAQYVVDQEGKRVAVILPFDEYERMKEDLHDLAVVAERREEEPVSLEEMKRRLREDGLL